VYTIGEFSMITVLTVKALRHYHEIGLLVPGYVDPESGYRYYTQANIEKARAIRFLRDLTFSLEEIKEVLQDCRDDADAVDYLQKKRSAIETQVEKLKTISKDINHLIQVEREAAAMVKESQFDIEEKKVGPIQIASIRWKGSYPETGKYIGQVGRKAGRKISGPPFNLYYDEEYKETDADVESCFPVRDGEGLKGVEVKTLPGGKCVSLVHQGPYEQIGRSYAKVTDYIKDKRYKAATPSREIYLKGPGMIFKGNPKNYLTEIQVFIEGKGRS